ncbi:MAG: hypothetical protein GY719_41715 [bacterium]|nr:hypothetical protein [bacterium]
MPNPTQMVLAPPTSPSVFEELVMEVLQRKYKNQSLSLYGRSGQPQEGIDGIDQSRNPGGLAWQTTLRTKGLRAKLERDFQRARTSTYRPSTFLFVTAARRDTALVRLAAVLSADECRVEVLFWDDLWNELSKWPELCERYYGDWVRPRSWWEGRAVLTLLFVVALGVASVLGGALWVVLWRGLGGTVEPHGLAALAWPVVTVSPVCLVAWAFARRSGLTAIETVGFLVGLVAGSWLFYDLPIGPHQGARYALESLNWSPVRTEALLVLIWSTTLSICASLCASITRTLVEKRSVTAAKHDLFPAMAVPIVTVCIPVWVYISIFPTSEFEAARGVIAGIALRVGLGLGLVLPFLTSLSRPDRAEPVSPDEDWPGAPD